MYGNQFPATDMLWANYEPFGWVHESEEYTFCQNHSQCAARGTWHRNHDTVPIGNGARICKEEAKANWLLCPYGERWYRKDDAVEVKNDDDKPVLVSPYAMKNHFRRCDYSGEYRPRNSCCHIKGSAKYKFVHASFMTFDNGFAECPNCSYKCETSSIASRPGGLGKMCQTCYTQHLNVNNILPHNADNYPPAIYSRRFRLGCTTRSDGLVYATNKKMEVPDVRLWGVEVETEMSVAVCKKNSWDRHTLARSVKDTLGSDFVITKEDGTLNMNGKYSDCEGKGPVYGGFEIVTAPADMATQRERWMKLDKMAGFEALRAWDTETCGFHVHVNKKTITTLQLGRMLTFINHPNNKPFIQKVAGRSERKFTRYYDKRLSDALHPERVSSPEEDTERNRRRRVALNVSNTHTIEWRIFRGTVNPRHILRNLEFCEAMVDFCYPAARSLSEFGDHRFFVDFISKHRKRWPLLAGWLAHWKFIELPVLGEKANHALITLKPEVDEHEDKTDGNYDNPNVLKPSKLTLNGVGNLIWGGEVSVAALEGTDDEEEETEPESDEDSDE